MKTPIIALMKHYGTAGIFKEKTAGVTPFAARVAQAVFAEHMIHDAGNEMDLQRMEAHQLNEQFRLIEQREMAPALQGLQHTRAPIFAGKDVPVGWDEGMVRLASIAHNIGVEMAKRAAGPMVPAVTPTMASPGVVQKPAATATPAKSPGLIRSVLGSSMGRKVLGYGALAGGGYLALKGVNKGLGAMARPAQQENYGSGYQVPMGTNQYGAPQLGTSLIG